MRIADFKYNLTRYSQVKFNLVPYWFLAVLRVFLTLLPQSGYIHPDEFFQSIEVMAGDVFDTDVSRPWEFNTTFPVRNVVFPYIIGGLPLKFLRSLAPYAYHWLGINLHTPYMFLVFPRFMCCCLSFISDYCLYRICSCYGQNYRTRLITLASSYVTIVFGTRTFSNTIEMVLLSILLCLVADCMSFSDKVISHDEFFSDKYEKAKTPVERVKFYKLRNSLPSHSFTSCFAVATVAVVGIFNRPTFMAFAFPPVFFWLHRGLGSKHIGFGQFHLRILVFILSGIPATMLFIIIDSYYYGYLTNSEIQELKVSLNNFVVTPLNFLRYNTVLTNLSKHGLHPRYLHTLVNVPLLYNVLGIIGLATFLKMLYKGFYLKRWNDLPRVQSIIGLMTASFILPVAALSIFPHQEARFLIPITLPVVFLYSQRIRQISNVKQRHEGRCSRISFVRGSGHNQLLSLWYLCNILFVLFFGFLHQGGIFPLLKHFSLELQSKPPFTSIHLVTSHIYSLPISLLQLHNSQRTIYNKTLGLKYRKSRQFFTYEMGSQRLEDVHSKVSDLLQQCEQKLHSKKLGYRLYLALPGTLVEDFYSVSYDKGSNFSSVLEYTFYPHISTEALPKLLPQTDCTEDDEATGFCENEHFYNAPFKFLLKLVQQFGLCLIRIETMKYFAY